MSSSFHQHNIIIMSSSSLCHCHHVIIIMSSSSLCHHNHTIVIILSSACHHHHVVIIIIMSSSSLCHCHHVIIIMSSPSLCHHKQTIVIILSSACHHHYVIIIIMSSSLCHHHYVIIIMSSSSPVSSRVVDLALGVDCKQTSAADGKQIWLGSFRLSVRSSVGSHRGSLLRHQMIAHSLQQQLFTLGSFSHQRLFINIIHQKLSEI